MEEKRLERRACQRFNIPGATASYAKEKVALRKKEVYSEEFCPVVDISRGGVQFLTQKPLKYQTRLTLKISIPGERVPLTLKGEVRWTALNPGKSYKYQIGVQFYPYGEKEDQNYPGNLVKIIALEQKFVDRTEISEKEDESKKDEFSI